MEDDEEIWSSGNKQPSLDEVNEINESIAEERVANHVAMTNADQCKLVSDSGVSNLAGEESAAVEKGAMAVVPPDVRVETKEEAVTTEDGEKFVGETPEVVEETDVAVLKLKTEEKEVIGSEEKFAVDEGSEAVAAKEEVLGVEEELESAKIRGETMNSSVVAHVQGDVTEPVTESEGEEKAAKVDELSEEEKVVSDVGEMRVGVAEPAVVAEGDKMVIAEDEVQVMAVTAAGDSSIEFRESVIEKSVSISVTNSFAMETESVEEEPMRNGEKLSPELDDPLTESAISIRDIKIYQGMAEGISVAETKAENEVYTGSDVAMDMDREKMHISELHEPVVDGEASVVAKEETQEFKEFPVEESFAGDAQPETEEQIVMKEFGVAKVETDEVLGIVEEKSVQNERDEVWEMMEDNCLAGNELDTRKGLGMDLEESNDKALDSQCTISESLIDDINGKDKEAEVKQEMGTEDTRKDAAMETEVDRLDNVNDGEGEDLGESDNPRTPQDEEDEAMVIVDTEVETETDVPESGKAAVGKRKRATSKSSANSKVTPKARKTIEEDVCFICFDGGELVLCDRRGCPKAYHPSCVNRDEAFFRAKGRWNCGWHLCSICEKNANFFCYTCPFSLCKGCIKDSNILCVRGNKGFCETCIRTVRLIENNEQGCNKDQVDFDDKTSWEFLFKDYYIDLKSKLSLSSSEVAEAKNPLKAVHSAGKQDKVPVSVQEKIFAGKQESPESPAENNDDAEAAADDSNENVEATRSRKRKLKKVSKTRSKGENSSRSAEAIDDKDNSMAVDCEWASKELLEFVMHMKNGDGSVLSQYDVQALLLEYIKRNNLRDPRQKCRIVCDSRLQNLFGKPRVGHFEMLKLLESHFLMKEDPQTDDVQGSVVDTEIEQLEADGNTNTQAKGVRDRKRKARRKGDRRGPQFNLDDYAAIDMHNISLIFLRRKLMEDLLEDIETFHDKVVGTFVRIRISSSGQKQDIYRLVQVLGTSNASDPYKVGKRTTNIMLEILNLNKTEVISIDTISNQDFTEEECKRLRQSIKCGLINRLTVGEILDKATELQNARVNDWLESEIVRLSHLRDRASEKGRKKDLRECVEKLQLLKTPEERQRRLEEVPEIHDDPKMDPSYESEDDGSDADDRSREVNTKIRGSGRVQGQISPGSDFYSKDSWSSGGKYFSKNWELDRNMSSKSPLSNKVGDSAGHIGELASEMPWNQGRERGTLESSSMEKSGSAINSETVGRSNHDVPKSEPLAALSSVTLPSSVPASGPESTIKINESEKMWHYQDPSGKVQGPFSMVQLRKWSNTGYFPAGLRIWRTTEKQDDSILLTDALAGKFQREAVDSAATMHSSHVLSGNLADTVKSSLEHGREGQDRQKLNADQNHATGNSISHVSSPSGKTVSSIEHPKLPSERFSQSGSSSLPSPTPTNNAGWTGQSGPLISATSSSGGNGVLQSTAAVLPEYPTHSSTPGSFLTSSLTLRASEDNSINSGSGPSMAPNSEHGALAVLANTLQNSHAVAMSEPHAVQMHSQVATPQAPLLQSGSGQNPSWGSAPSQKVEANHSIPVPGQQHSYGQWGFIPAAPQTGNFSQGSQPNMQLLAMPNMSYPVGMTENNPPAPALRPENQSFNWGGMQSNQHMGWVGAAPVNANMNWGATVQAPTSANAVPGWTMPPGNLGGTVQGQVPANANPVWAVGAATPAVQGLPHGSANQSWVASAGNVASTVQGPVPGNAWTPPVGNPGPGVTGPVPGNANQGWGAPPGNQGTWGSEQNHGGKVPGHRDEVSHGGDSGFGGGRPWNRQSSFGNSGSGGYSRRFPRHQMLCPYNTNGQCKKGASCNYLHN